MQFDITVGRVSMGVFLSWFSLHILDKCFCKSVNLFVCSLLIKALLMDVSDFGLQVCLVFFSLVEGGRFLQKH